MRINLKLAILEAGKTQREVAVTCGIAESRFSEIVRGWREPRPEERERLARELSCSQDRLFQGSPGTQSLGESAP